MTIEAVSFAIGGILIATAIVGGGFEIKEIKMPKVGAVPRFFSMIVGAFFVMIGLGTWGFDRQALLTANATGNALAPETAQQAEVSSNAFQQSERSVQSASQVPLDEVPAQPAQTFTGLSGKVRLTWSLDGVPYEAVVETRQLSGFVRVTYDNGAGAWEEVDQDLVLRESEQGPYYEGLNPRYASTQAAHPGYLPDYFRMAQVDTEHWAYTHVCSSDVCEPVATAEVLP